MRRCTCVLAAAVNTCKHNCKHMVLHVCKCKPCGASLRKHHKLQIINVRDKLTVHWSDTVSTEKHTMNQILLECLICNSSLSPILELHKIKPPHWLVVTCTCTLHASGSPSLAPQLSLHCTCTRAVVHAHTQTCQCMTSTCTCTCTCMHACEASPTINHLLYTVHCTLYT